MPMVDPTQPSGQGDHRSTLRQPQGAAAPVSVPNAAPTLLDAVQQAPAKPAHSEVQFLAARDGAEGSAQAKAEAARAAYISASIAAGVSPLPLPGL
jgi:hypothetical protein